MTEPSPPNSEEPTSPDGRTVAVVGDAEAALHRYTSLIEDLAGVRAHAVVHDPGTGPVVLPAGTGAIFAPHATTEAACHLRAHTGVPVLTGQDTAAIALAAAVSTALAHAGRPPRSSHVVIAGADALPVLCPLVMVGEVGTVTTWNLTDAQSFPLSRVTAGADVVIDLLGLLAPDTASGPAVIVPDPERDIVLALPGLVRALLPAPAARLDVDAHHACALALVMATPSDQPLPHEPGRDLTDRIADAAAAALTQHSLETDPG